VIYVLKTLKGHNFPREEIGTNTELVKGGELIAAALPASST
jgi:hypothetical protein